MSSFEIERQGLDSIRTSILEQRIEQIQGFERVEIAGLLTAGGALGTMACVGIGSENVFLQLCGGGAFLFGVICGVAGVVKHLWPPSALKIRALRDANK